ncbi:outer membrane protein assembly factor BamE [Pyxidicoccus parkwayensis]|uniref:Outer membrane protein assembly factor BamE n=1 Tax=Pyxidicoccus parkwayensis TaxID=2813578 RepID=A0ABX7NKF2_9BACT|nr:outer membrane protein assembly factor BamE [Pyxidicoccus parkwaysis]QSQ19332.1 outer membrane protein assembly factor BamE [Pyxidicoccus parkwaysis]
MQRRLVAVAVLVAACGSGASAPAAEDTQSAVSPDGGLPPCLSDELVGHSTDDVLACAGLPCGAVMTDSSDVERWVYCSNTCKGDCGTRYHVSFSDDGVVTETRTMP